MSRKQRKKIIRLAIALVILIAIMLYQPSENIALFLYAIPFLISGYDILLNAFFNIIHGRLFDEMFLMALATIGAFGIAEYKEAIAVMIFFQIGEIFQSIAVGKSRKSIAELMDIRPDEACLLQDNQELIVDPEDLEIDQIILIKPGEKVPLDCQIIEGMTAVNTVALTGETTPQDKKVNDELLSGSVNLTGVIKARVTKPFAESTVAKILELVENAADKKAKSEEFITKFARYYTPIVVILAVILTVFGPLITHDPFSDWLKRSLIFLVISCPCALVVSVPLSFFGGIGRSAKDGILIKGANYMEKLATIDTLVLDKTGTLTKGNFKVVAVHPKIYDQAKIIQLAASLEAKSNHPIALSIIDHNNQELLPIEEVVEIAGNGLIGLYQGKQLLVGNHQLMVNNQIEDQQCSISGTIIHLAYDQQYLGHIIIGDEIKPKIAQSIQNLKHEGIKRTIMLTGDSLAVAQDVAQKAGLDGFYANLLPQDKVQEIERLLIRPEVKVLAFVGDGINDAPSLSRADLGIAMGAVGSDAAIEAADVVLMHDELDDLNKAMKIAKKTIKIVQQNIYFAIGIKILVLILGAFGLANMWMAIFADVGVTVLAIFNSMRTLKKIK